MAVWKNMAVWKRLEAAFRRPSTTRRNAARYGGGALRVEGLEHRLCPSPVLLVADANGNQVLAYDATTGAFRGVYVAPGSGGLDTPDLGIIGGLDGNVYLNSSKKAPVRNPYCLCSSPRGIGPWATSPDAWDWQDG